MKNQAIKEYSINNSHFNNDEKFLNDNNDEINNLSNTRLIRIIVLGAGFGGLSAVKNLNKYLKKFGILNKVEIFLIDSNDYHTYTPLLYEVASTSKSHARNEILKKIAAIPISEIVNNKAKTFKAKIIDIKINESLLVTSNLDTFSFDYLLISLGSVTDFMSIPGIETHALELKSITDALNIRSIIENKLEKNNSRLMRILIGGGGSTGVELAGELERWCTGMRDNGVTANLWITIIEANDCILKPFNNKFRKLAEDRLKLIGVNVIVNEKIITVKDNVVITESGQIIPYDVFIWTAGVKGPDFLNKIKLNVDSKNRLVVSKFFETQNSISNIFGENLIYAIGDSSSYINPKKNHPVASTAHVAIKESKIVAYNIVSNIADYLGKNKKYKYISFKPKDYPYILPIGGRWAIAKIGYFLISGLSAWAIKYLVELMYLLSIMKFNKAFAIWFKGIKLFMNNK